MRLFINEGKLGHPEVLEKGLSMYASADGSSRYE